MAIPDTCRGLEGHYARVLHKERHTQGVHKTKTMTSAQASKSKNIQYQFLQEHAQAAPMISDSIKGSLRPVRRSTRSPSPFNLENANIITTTTPKLKPKPKPKPELRGEAFLTKLRAALRLPYNTVDDFLSRVPGLDFEQSIHQGVRILGGKNAQDIQTAFGFPATESGELTLSAPSKEDAVARASVRLTAYMIELADAAVASKDYYPETDRSGVENVCIDPHPDDSDDEGEDEGGDPMVTFYMKVASALHAKHVHDQEWTPLYGAGALSAGAKEDLLRVMISGRENAENERWAVKSDLTGAIDRWHDVWLIKTGRI